jgi:cytochrome c oxidase subunit II
VTWPLALDPAGPSASQITGLIWLLLAVTGTVFVAVCAALYLAYFGTAKWKGVLARNATILLSGFALPVVVLTGLLSYSLIMTRGILDGERPGDMSVRVTGEMWWWRVTYLDAHGNEMNADANELHIPVGQRIAVELRAADVIHSFWIPQLGGKEDMIPGRANMLVIAADKPGVYSGQCAEFCGGPHALMGFKVVAHTQENFKAWGERQRINPQPPQDVLARQGADLFLRVGCAACHAVRGTEAKGAAGPDLTFVGSRQSLGAGILPNNRGTLAGWVADAQTIKPGNRMPSYPMLSGVELQALSAYLEQLR